MTSGITSGIVSSMGDALKARENRLRRMASRQGLQLLKNPRRDPRATDYGSYMLVDMNNAQIADFGWDHARFPEGSSWLDDIEAYLTAAGTPITELPAARREPAPTPRITGAVSARLAELSDLQSGWLDGEGAEISPSVISLAGTVQAALADRGVGSPAIFPTPDGGILFEWARGPWQLSVEVRPDLSLHLVQVHGDAGALIESVQGQSGLGTAIAAMNALGPAKTGSEEQP